MLLFISSSLTSLSCFCSQLSTLIVFKNIVFPSVCFSASFYSSTKMSNILKKIPHDKLFVSGMLSINSLYPILVEIISHSLHLFRRYMNESSNIDTEELVYYRHNITDE